MAAAATKPELKRAMYLGATLTAVISLLPYISDFFISAYLAGALAAVWFAIRKDRQIRSLKDGAQLGFLSGFYGLLAASAVYDVLWQFLDYRLWKIQNLDRLLSIFARMVHDTFSLSAWFLVTIQIIAAAVFAGAFGAPSGILAVKIFQGRAVH
jgi:hypothetical protein